MNIRLSPDFQTNPAEKRGQLIPQYKSISVLASLFGHLPFVCACTHIKDFISFIRIFYLSNGKYKFLRRNFFNESQELSSIYSVKFVQDIISTLSFIIWGSYIQQDLIPSGFIHNHSTSLVDQRLVNFISVFKF